MVLLYMVLSTLYCLIRPRLTGLGYGLQKVLKYPYTACAHGYLTQTARRVKKVSDDSPGYFLFPELCSI